MMRVTTMMPDVQYQMQQSQQALSTALQQVSTSLRVNQLSDDPSASANMVSSLATSATVDQYTSNATTVTSLMQSADAAISTVVTSLNSAITVGTQGANGTESTANKQALATQMQSILTDVIAKANTEYQGSYIFGGSETSTPPFVAASTTYTSAQGTAASPLAATTGLTAGSVTSISESTGETMVFKAATGDTVATLQAAVASAVSAGTLSAGTTATINATTGQLSISTNSSTTGIVVSSNDAALGAMSTLGTTVANAYAYVGNSTVNSVQVGDAMNVQTNVPGSTLFGSGSGVISSLAGLITALQTGGTTEIGDATAAVSTALTHVSQVRVPFDNAISQVSDQETYLGTETLSLKTQQSSLVGISLDVAATNLSQAELVNSAVLGAAAKALPQTLLDYLK
jgi:flagellar hook-associated protein 3